MANLHRSPSLNQIATVSRKPNEATASEFWYYVSLAVRSSCPSLMAPFTSTAKADQVSASISRTSRCKCAGSSMLLRARA